VSDYSKMKELYEAYQDLAPQEEPETIELTPQEVQAIEITLRHASATVVAGYLTISHGEAVWLLEGIRDKLIDEV